jgi:hypothetical protein
LFYNYQSGKVFRGGAGLSRRSGRGSGTVWNTVRSGGAVLGGYEYRGPFDSLTSFRDSAVSYRLGKGLWRCHFIDHAGCSPEGSIRKCRKNVGLVGSFQSEEHFRNCIYWDSLGWCLSNPFSSENTKEVFLWLVAVLRTGEVPSVESNIEITLRKCFRALWVVLR